MASVEVRQGGYARTGELAVRVVDDDVAKALGWVQELKGRRAAAILIRRPAACAPVLALVLIREDHVNAIEESLGWKVGNPRETERLYCQHSLQPLGGAIRNGPAMVLSGEGPRALGDVPVMLLELNTVFAYLCAVDEGVCLPQDAGHLPLLAQAGRDDRLYCKGRVPQLRPVVPVHLHPVLCEPQVVEDAWQVRAEAFSVGILPEATDKVDRLVDRANVNESRRLILMRNEIGAPGKRPGA
mmetsp:Transcript_7060/g.21702  ORF Transcript_7060/g.21702 Transcript_7060/m.21702 type:complete len:242 (+) Transcript_7060:944-1669(+)